MKATYQGVTMEGTPKEIDELVKLLDERTEKKAWIPYVDKTQPHPWYPGKPYVGTGNPPPTFVGAPLVTDGGYATWTGGTTNKTMSENIITYIR